MYTQCPECGVAFRISADVLKMAAGKVRCGGCGSAFNALEHLSESKPAAPLPVEKEADPDLPELQPDAPELIADTPPETISAADSAALLKTLDQLAGEDIRIEDTGSEWRVVDEDEVSAATQEPRDEPSQVIDEMLFDEGPRVLDHLVGHQSQDARLGLEVVEEGGRCDVGAFGDLLYGGRLEAALAEKVAGRVVNARSKLTPAALPAPLGLPSGAGGFRRRPVAGFFVGDAQHGLELRRVNSNIGSDSM